MISKEKNMIHDGETPAIFKFSAMNFYNDLNFLIVSLRYRLRHMGLQSIICSTFQELQCFSLSCCIVWSTVSTRIPAGQPRPYIYGFPGMYGNSG